MLKSSYIFPSWGLLMKLCTRIAPIKFYNRISFITIKFHGEIDENDVFLLFSCQNQVK